MNKTTASIFPFLFALCLSLYCVWIGVIDPETIQEFTNREMTSIVEDYGQKTATLTAYKAESWYSEVFIESGLKEKVLDSIADTVVASEAGSFIAAVDNVWLAVLDYLKGRIDVISQLLWWIFARAALLLQWLPLWCPVFVVATLDGVFQRKVKLYTFGYTNPSYARIFTGLIKFVMLLAVLGIIAPLPLPAWFLPLLFALIVCSIGFIIKNLPTRMSL